MFMLCPLNLNGTQLDIRIHTSREGGRGRSIKMKTIHADLHIVMSLHPFPPPPARHIAYALHLPAFLPFHTQV